MCLTSQHRQPGKSSCSSCRLVGVCVYCPLTCSLASLVNASSRLSFIREFVALVNLRGSFKLHRSVCGMQLDGFNQLMLLPASCALCLSIIGLVQCVASHRLTLSLSVYLSIYPSQAPLSNAIFRRALEPACLLTLKPVLQLLFRLLLTFSSNNVSPSDRS